MNNDWMQHTLDLFQVSFTHTCLVSNWPTQDQISSALLVFVLIRTYVPSSHKTGSRLVDLHDGFFFFFSFSMSPLLHNTHSLWFVFQGHAFQFLPFGLFLVPWVFTRCMQSALSPLMANMTGSNVPSPKEKAIWDMFSLLTRIMALLVHLERRTKVGYTVK